MKFLFVIFFSLLTIIISQDCDTTTQEIPTLNHDLNFAYSMNQSFGIIFVSVKSNNTFMICLIFSSKLSLKLLVVVDSLAMFVMNLFSILIGYSLPFILYTSMKDWIMIAVFLIYGFILINDSNKRKFRYQRI